MAASLFFVQTCILLGTRPEAIKLAPVISEFRRRGLPFRLVDSGQHPDLLPSHLAEFGLACDRQLPPPPRDHSLGSLAAHLLRTVTDHLEGEERPGLLVVQGDTATALAGALAAHIGRIPLAHVEAGLRSGRLDAPFPEEANRRVIDLLADWCFAPTGLAAERLRSEGVAAGRIEVTGNTVVDALEAMRHRFSPPERILPDRPLVVVTAHRRESFGEPLVRLCQAVRRLTGDDPATGPLEVVWSLHPNPEVRRVVEREMRGIAGVRLLPPFPYLAFLSLLASAELVLSDSGGIQEEAPSLGVPVLVLRDVTERPEGIDSGWLELVGTDPDRIVTAANRRLAAGSPVLRGAGNPFGDGRAAERIVDRLVRDLGLSTGA